MFCPTERGGTQNVADRSVTNIYFFIDAFPYSYKYFGSRTVNANADIDFYFSGSLLCLERRGEKISKILDTMNYPKKPGFNLYELRHCACIT